MICYNCLNCYINNISKQIGIFSGYFVHYCFFVFSSCLITIYRSSNYWSNALSCFMYFHAISPFAKRSYYYGCRFITRAVKVAALCITVTHFDKTTYDEFRLLNQLQSGMNVTCFILCITPVYINTATALHNTPSLKLFLRNFRWGDTSIEIFYYLV